jgi:hypothetical protein
MFRGRSKFKVRESRVTRRADRQITPEGKTQAGSKAQQPRQYVSISRGLQRRHRGSDGVMKPLLETYAISFSAPCRA